MKTMIHNNFKPKLILNAVLLIVLVYGTAFSQASNVYKLQSLFLYNFTKHVKWDVVEGESLTVGIYANSEALTEIRSNLENKMAWGKNIKVIEISSAEEVSNCHIAYLPKSNKKKILALIGSANLSNTLLVTEDDLVADGAAISFIIDQQSKLKFKISRTQIEQVGLKVSSSLISIGIAV